MNGSAHSPQTSLLHHSKELVYLAQLLLLTTPAYVRMRADPELHNWRTDLARFGEREELRDLAGALGHVAAGISADDSFALLNAVDEESARIDLDTIARACMAAEEAAKESPYASLLLAWTAFLVWVVGAPRRGEDLLAEQDGWPNVGWGRIPETVIKIAIKTNGLHGSRLLAERAYAVLQANWHRHESNRGRLDPALGRYRRLLQDIFSRYEMAVLDLTDDLREAWSADTGRIRAWVAALLWSLGLVPECSALQKGAAPPSRRLLKLLIHRSMDCLSADPLMQYLWLELKEYPGFDLRSHQALYIIINHRWEQWSVDEMHMLFGYPAEPSRLYARSLVALMAGERDDDATAGFLSFYDWVVDAKPQLPVRGYVLHRLYMLRHLIGERYDYYMPDFTPEARLDFLKDRTDAAGRGRVDLFLHPGLPDILCRTSHSSFEMIEKCLADDAGLAASEAERSTLVIETMERFRTGALSYWLLVNPPLLPPVPRPEPLELLLREERSLLEGLRGAYFIALRPTLPHHLLWAEMDAADRWALQDPARREWFYSPDVARDEIHEIERSILELADRLEPHAPEYAERRRAPSADVRRLVATLNLHTSPATT